MNKKFLTILLTALTICICTYSGNASSTTLKQQVFRPKPISLSECEKIKSKYGIPVCTVDGDYWVGAVVECGGVDKLPRATDFYNPDKWY